MNINLSNPRKFKCSLKAKYGLNDLKGCFIKNSRKITEPLTKNFHFAIQILAKRTKTKYEK